jgi:hypothetical protein
MLKACLGSRGAVFFQSGSFRICVHSVAEESLMPTPISMLPERKELEMPRILVGLFRDIFLRLIGRIECRNNSSQWLLLRLNKYQSRFLGVTTKKYLIR